MIQKHAARRLHYDLRLEHAGVLKSWAVPKGPAMDPALRRLAVLVEDHPLEYASFEGAIPRGSYGAGHVIVWDHGTYRLIGSDSFAEQLAAGHIELTLSGLKLHGQWMLVRTKDDGEPDGKTWILRKRPDAYAGGSEPTDTLPASVLSGRTLEALAEKPAAPSDIESRLAALRLPRGSARGADLSLMLPTLVTSPPADAGWVFEIKWDGVRVLALRHADTLTLVGRAGTDMTAQYPEIAAGVARLPGGDLALDGEIVAVDARGRPNFHALQRRMHRQRGIEAAVAETPVVAHLYDCLTLGGRDLRRLPLRDRKAWLQEILPPSGALRFCDHLEGDGDAVLEAVGEMGLEGIVAKRLDAPYRGGRRREWLKIKCDRRQEFVIGGYTDPKGSRAHLGAVHVGVYEGRALVYVGKVGSSLPAAELESLHRALVAHASNRCPFTRGAVPHDPEHHWVRPKLVCEVRFTEWTPDGNIRHPIFLGLRDDKDPRTVRRETPLDVVSVASRRSAVGARAPRRPRRPPRP